ncbi:hypothetical protein [Paraburkholderia youngii]|uniref:hypothetical protein n=1 Tax=Paraburkholderia youngii TaxID=2782701 RepID=UPI0020D134AD|nr:hypothetical protein [Paraburkholderia youngii]
MNNFSMVLPWGKEFQGRAYVFEQNAHVGLPTCASARSDATVPDFDDAAEAPVHQPDPGDNVPLLEALTIGGETACRQVEYFGQREQNRFEHLSLHGFTLDETLKQEMAKALALPLLPRARRKAYAAALRPSGASSARIEWSHLLILLCI